MNRRTIPSIVPVLLLLLVFAAGCAEREDPASVPIQAHPSGWTDPANDDFHGEYLQRNFAAIREARDAEPGLGDDDLRDPADGCRSCHGEALGLQSQDQCLACHEVGNVEDGGHPARGAFVSPAGEAFHGQAIADAMSTEQCQVCHGYGYDGGWVEVSCARCHEGGRSGHPSTVSMFRPSDDDFHAKRLAERGPANCAQCHGEKGGGGWAGVGCAACHSGNPANAGGLSGHPAPEIWNDSSSADFHGNQNFEECRACHGEDLLGGEFVSADFPRLSCNACHSWPLGR